VQRVTGFRLSFEQFDDVSVGSAKQLARTLSMTGTVSVVGLVFSFTLLRPVQPFDKPRTHSSSRRLKGLILFMPVLVVSSIVIHLRYN